VFQNNRGKKGFWPEALIGDERNPRQGVEKGPIKKGRFGGLGRGKARKPHGHRSSILGKR